MLLKKWINVALLAVPGWTSTMLTAGISGFSKVTLIRLNHITYSVLLTNHCVLLVLNSILEGWYSVLAEEFRTISLKLFWTTQHKDSYYWFCFTSVSFYYPLLNSLILLFVFKETFSFSHNILFILLFVDLMKSYSEHDETDLGRLWFISLHCLILLSKLFSVRVVMLAVGSGKMERKTCK